MSSSQQHSNSTHLQLATSLFPFTFKAHQKEQLAQLVRQQHTLWHAPTGFGKSLLAICAMLPVVFDPTFPMKKILIVVRTKTQIYRILEDVHLINLHLKEAEQQKILQEFIHQRKRSGKPKIEAKVGVQNSSIKQILAVPLIAKRELCVHEDKNRVTNLDCRAMKCSRKKKKKDIFPELVLTEARAELQNQLLKSSEIIRNVITETTETQMECPHDIVTDLVAGAEILITTHPWLHQHGLRKRLDKLFANNLSITGVILDEVHNFAPTWTAQFCLEDLLGLLLEYEKHHQEWNVHFESRNFLVVLANSFQQSPRGPLPSIGNDDLKLTTALLQNYYNHLKPRLRDKDSALTKLENIIYFLKASGDYWIKISVKNQSNANKSFIFRLIAYPTTIFSSLKTSSKSIYMLGTLNPISVYQWYYDLENSFSVLQAPVPPRKEMKLLLETPALVAKHNNRTPRFYETLAKFCLLCHQSNPRHTLIFTTSKKFSQHLHRMLQAFAPAFKTSYIYKEGNSEENQFLLQKLPQLKHALLVAQMGGSFHEGIEIRNPYTGQSKISLIIIAGIPYAPPSILFKQLKIIYQSNYPNKKVTNWLLQQLPAIQTIRQASGRGIRSATDSCAIICTDKRLLRLQFFPDFIPVPDLNTIQTLLDQFYANIADTS